MMSYQYYVPERFQNTVAAHLVMNVINVPNLRTPLILAIHGPAGEGKTEQCRWVFQEMGVRAEWLFAEEFESKDAGEPARIIKDKYKAASNYNLEVQAEYKQKGSCDKPYKLHALFINDIDQRIGRSDPLIQQTINTQLVNTALMEIADGPDEIDGIKTCRVPIVITGNNLAVLHGPLRRDGRMEKFEWIPTLDEKVAIIRKIFPEQSLSDSDIRRLVYEFSTSESRRASCQGRSILSISSFATIRYRLYKNEIIQMIRDVGLPHVLDYVLKGKHLKRLRHPQITFESIRDMANELIQDGLLPNHLKELSDV
ncbi:MAG: hypothetical protein Kow00123_02130 [Anaerolineales bacterium]